jgi:uncharacterized membrane protein YbhN (UPF0104 family)
LVAVLIGVGIGIIALVPGLSGVGPAIRSASAGWVLLAAGIQLAGLAGAVLFVQLVFRDVAKPLTWRMGGGMQAGNAIMPTAGSTGVSYWTLSSIGWGTQRFAERTAVMIIAPAAPNAILIIIVGILMGLGVVSGPSDWWLTWLPAAIAALAIVIVIAAARWGHRLAARTSRKWLKAGLHVISTGVTGTVDVLRSRNWRVLGTWLDLLGSIGALWACLIAVNDHLPFAVVCMGYLIGQFAQIIPVPGGVGTIDAGVTGALILYGAPHTTSTAGEIISHALALLIPLIAGGIAFALLPGEIERQRRTSPEAATAPA